MRAQPWIAVLLIITITTAAARARTRAPLSEPSLQTEETPQLTPDEELEAREIAEQFIRRFEGSDDLLSIVDDLYVRDFDDRLRHNVAERFLVPIDSKLALHVKGDELRRCHIATLKFFYLYMLIYGASYFAHKLDGSATAEGSEKEFDPVEVLPPRAVDVIRNDPVFAEMILGSSKKDSEENSEQEEEAVAEDTEKKVEERDQTIMDMERLRGHVSILEQAVAIMREHLQTLPTPHTWEGLVDLMRKPDQETPRDRLRPRAYTLARDDFGCPAGTRLICLDVLLFHMDLVRVDGQLKILNVYVEFDD
jgi:hypothetical protein